jgi:uncharacterized protein YegJ (DUF2314 family)
MRHRLGIFVLFIVMVTGCGKKHPADKVIYVADDDPRMNAAMEKARSSVNTFITALRSPKSSQSGFSVKMAITDGKNTEHMWLSSVNYDGKSFHGAIDNEPDAVKTVKIGQQMSVEALKISDWMFVENGKLVGGYTIRVLRDTVPANERADFEARVCPSSSIEIVSL